jgi:hypothetical protein
MRGKPNASVRVHIGHAGIAPVKGCREHHRSRDPMEGQRPWCKTCGGHLFTEHPLWGLTDVYAATIAEFPYQPGVHVNYQETKLRIKDGLPKVKDVPKEMGGSGITLAE